MRKSPTFHLRSNSQLHTRSPWLWHGYSRTAGIEQYRKNERYAAWWHTHCQLKSLDEVYASDCRRFYWQILCSGVLACVLFVALSASYAVGTALNLAVFGAGCAAFLFCMSEQRRRNTCIGRRLAVTVDSPN
ncbi:MAG: hypothetical protein R3C53_06465 [Pirellulaceae bacterium]